jgi:hypothetical protein
LIDASLGSMSEAATRLHEEGSQDPGGASGTADDWMEELCLAIEDMHSATERSFALILQIVDRGDRLAGELAATRKNFSVGTLFAETVARARGSIEEIGEKTQRLLSPNESEEQEPGLADFMSHYTMQAELDVHRNVTRVSTGNASGVAPAEENNALAREADELGDNVEFF